MNDTQNDCYHECPICGAQHHHRAYYMDGVDEYFKPCSGTVCEAQYAKRQERIRARMLRMKAAARAA